MARDSGEAGARTSAIADTGPLLHLAEIGQLRTLGTFRRLWVPDLVASELNRYGSGPDGIDVAGLEIVVAPVAASRWERVVRALTAAGASIQPADAQVVVLALGGRRHEPVLTDDLVLRRVLESRGVIAVGSVGLLVRAHRAGLLDQEELRGAVDALFDRSTLHLSRPFRSYVRLLLDELQGEGGR